MEILHIESPVFQISQQAQEWMDMIDQHVFDQLSKEGNVPQFQPGKLLSKLEVKVHRSELQETEEGYKMSVDVAWQWVG